ncbi:MAG: hypothetical protein ABSB33_06735 [Tepidisphaeraceae bacterium]|jgi:hypothetical protein
MSRHYVGEKFWAAVYSLNAGPRSLQRKLSSAGQELHLLKPEDFKDLPQPILKAWEKLKFDLTADMRGSYEGSLDSTADTMSDETAERIASEIRRIYDELKALGFGLD